MGIIEKLGYERVMSVTLTRDRKELIFEEDERFWEIIEVARGNLFLVSLNKTEAIQLLGELQDIVNKMEE